MLAKDFKLASSIVPEKAGEAVDEEEYDRPQRTNILVLNCKEVVAKDKVVAEVSPYLLECGVENGSFTFSGPAAGKYFEVAFHGPALVGTRAANKAFRGLRPPIGSTNWKEFWVDTPSGEHARLWMSKDQNPKTMAKIFLGKKALVVLDRLGFDGMHLLKYEGYVMWKGKPFMRINPKADKSFDISINADCQPRRFRKDDFVKTLHEMVDRPLPVDDDIAWV